MWHAYMNIYIYIYIYIHTHVCVCVQVCKCMYVWGEVLSSSRLNPLAMAWLARKERTAVLRVDMPAGAVETRGGVLLRGVQLGP